MLIDSNIIIYAALPEHAELRQFIADHAPVVSAVSYVEVLGYHSLTADARQHFEQFFATAITLPLTDDVLQQAVKLRQTKKMTLGDSLVAGTALVHGHKLATCNTKDFSWIPGLSLLNPLDKKQVP